MSATVSLKLHDRTFGWEYLTVATYCSVVLIPSLVVSRGFMSLSKKGMNGARLEMNLAIHQP